MSGVLFVCAVADDGPRRRFDEWYDATHLPGRMQVPGFIRAIRYREVSMSPVQATACLYHLESCAVLESDAYLELQDRIAPDTAAHIADVELTRLAGEPIPSSQAEPVSAPQRKSTGPVSSHVDKTHELDHLAHASATDAMRLRHRQQMVVRRPAGVDRSRLEHRTDLVQRRPKLSVIMAIHTGHPRRWPVQPQEHAHRGRLTSAIRAEEASDDSRPDNKAQVLDRDLLAIALCQVFDLDHRRDCGRAHLKP